MTTRSRATLKTNINADIDSNGAGGITGAELNAILTDITDSFLSKSDDAPITVIARARVATTANVTISSLTAGSSQDGKTLAANDLVFVRAQTAPAENGLYVIAASGAPSRHSLFAGYEDHPGLMVIVKEGTVYHDTTWLCTSDPGGTIGTTALNFSSRDASAASDTTAGVVELATSAETATGTSTSLAVTPADLGPAAHFQAFRTANQTGVANGTTTVVAYTTEGFDVGGYYDAPNSRWTPPAGPVMLSASCRMSTPNLTDGARINVGILKNGASIGSISLTVNTAGGNPNGAGFSMIDVANGTDYYEAYILHTSTGPCTLDTNGQFSGARLR